MNPTSYENKDLAAVWSDVDLADLASDAARLAGVGDPADAGWTWTLPSEYPDLIPLGGGIPDAPTVPTGPFRDALNAALDEESDEAMVYGGWLGFDGLREAIAERQSRIDGVSLSRDNFIVHNGSSAAMDNIAKAFIQPGDVVIVEGPSFSGIVDTIEAYMASVVEAPIDEEGVSLEAVASVIAESEAAGKRVKMIYTIPDYQNPTGVTMSESRRAALLELCARHQILVVEDGAYSELYFDAPPPPSMYAMSGGAGVLRIGSFSKITATGLRIGWVQAWPEFVSSLTKVRFDMGTSPILLRAMARYLESGHLDGHLERMRELYALKCRVICDSLEESCAPYVKFDRPDGGFFLWLECVGAPASEVRVAAAEEGLIFPTGALFFNDRERAGDKYLRLAFSAASVEQLEKVGERLRAAFERVAS